jgi:hypothetical protein
MSTHTQPFLTALEQAHKTDCECGVFLWKNVLTPEETTRSFSILNNDDFFPWNLKPTLFGEQLTQHAYSYDRRSRSNQNQQQLAGIVHLEELCTMLQDRFDGEITNVFCNRFQDAQHQIDWHSDKYGSHILVLSLGSERDVQFRTKPQRRGLFGGGTSSSSSNSNGSESSTTIETLRPATGDVYFMPLHLNKTHHHRVCAAAHSNSTDEDKDDGSMPRISLVFFFQPPKYATDYKISVRDHMRGFFEGILE